MTLSLEIVKYCAEEVARQGRGPIQVFNMIDAWVYAMEPAQYVTPHSYYALGSPAFIALLGHLVEPTKNNGAFRGCGVRVGDVVCPPPNEVKGLIDRYIDALPRMSPAEAYKEFERIHPFVDGNGRVGKIVFNMVNKTLDHPVMPPNFWGIANP